MAASTASTGRAVHAASGGRPAARCMPSPSYSAGPHLHRSFSNSSASWKRVTMRCPCFLQVAREQKTSEQLSWHQPSAQARPSHSLYAVAAAAAGGQGFPAAGSPLPPCSTAAATTGPSAPQSHPPPHAPHGRLEAAGRRPGVEPGVVHVSQVHAHEPEAQRGVLDGRELEWHARMHVHQHATHFAGHHIPPAHHVVGVDLEPCRERQQRGDRGEGQCLHCIMRSRGSQGPSTHNAQQSLKPKETQPRSHSPRPSLPPPHLCGCGTPCCSTCAPAAAAPRCAWPSGPGTAAPGCSPWSRTSAAAAGSWAAR